MPERRLESENIDSSLYHVPRMAMPQLVWVNMEPGGSSPLSAYISDGLSCEVPSYSGAWKDKAAIFAAAKSFKQRQRVTGYSDSASFSSLPKEVNLTSIV